jgi:hypothetical protein
VKVLFVGCGGGSWEMRGRQIAKAFSAGKLAQARATTGPTDADWAWCDQIVLVKRAVDKFGQAAKATGHPIAWDVLDFWAQPGDNQTPVSALIERVASIRARLGIRTLIAATARMADDIGGHYITHHCRIDLTPTPIRATAAVVGYDGSARYLGSWRAVIETACEALGLRFVVNPSDLTQVDALVSFRGEKWDGEACRRWKSGVKYVNAIAAGRPILTQACAAYAEIGPVGATVETHGEVVDALADMTRMEERERAYEHAIHTAHRMTVNARIPDYSWICQSMRRAA